MKKTALTVLAVILTICASKAQNSGQQMQLPSHQPDDVINLPNLENNYLYINLCEPRIYFGPNGKTYRRLEMKARELNVFKLINANTVKYNYILNRSFIQFNTDASNNALAQAALSLKQTSTDISADQPKKAAAAASINKLSITKDSLQTKKDNLKTQKDALKMVKVRGVNQFTKTDAKTNTSLVAESNKVSAQLTTVTKQLEKYNNKYYETADDDNKEDFLTKYNNLIARSKGNLPFLNESLFTDTSRFKKHFIAVLTSANTYLDMLKSRMTDIKADATLHNCVNRDSVKNIPTSKQIGAGIDFIRELALLYQDIFLAPDPAFTEMNTSAVKIADDLSPLYSAISSLNQDEYLLPLDVNGKNIDLVRINLQITEKEKPTSLDTYTYDIYIKGGFKFDFSAGVFLTKLIDNTYSFKDTTVGTTAEKIIQKKNTGNFNFGVGSMVNMSLRTGGSWIAPGISVGVLFSNQQKLQLLFAGTAIFGKEERLAFHYGLALGSVSYLDSAYKVGNAYVFGASTTPPTVQKFLTSTFFGISYNLSSPKVETPNAVK